MDQAADAHGQIAWLQAQGGPVADALAGTLSFLGDELFYLLLIPVVYWVFSTRQALRLAGFVLLSTWLNAALKSVWDTPRPDPDLVRIAGESVPPGGIPSGHAQNGAVTWGFLAWALGRREGTGTHTGPAPPWILWVAAFLLALGIGLSRIYRGVHFPVDVLVGWGLGVAFLGGGLFLLPRVERWIEGRSFGARLVLAGGLPGLLLILFHEELALPAVAALAGAWAGAVLAGSLFAFDPSVGGWGRRLGRVMIGIPGAGVIWVGGPVLLAAFGPTGDLILYTTLGLWVSLGGPALFRSVGLAPDPDRAR